MVTSKKLYSEAEITEHMRAWLALVEIKRDEAVAAYDSLVTATENSIKQDVKQSHTEEELEEMLEAFIDENILDATWKSLSMDEYLNILPCRLLKKELGAVLQFLPQL